MRMVRASVGDILTVFSLCSPALRARRYGVEEFGAAAGGCPLARVGGEHHRRGGAPELPGRGSRVGHRGHSSMTLSLPAVSRVSELITRSSSRSCWMQRALRHRAPPHAPAAREIRRRSVTLFVENEGKIVTLVGRDVMDYDVLSARCLSLARPRHSNPRRWELRCGLRRRGRQGLGFKYVFQFTRTPRVHSRDFHFHFDFPRLGKC